MCLFFVFLVIKITLVHQVRMSPAYCGLSVKTAVRKTPQGVQKIVDSFVLHLCVVSKNPKTPNLSPMADDAITQWGIHV